jgi:hypothetical protein
MADLNEQMQLAAEMAAISAVKSHEIVSMAKTTSDLDNFQNKLGESKDRVMMVKDVLSSTAPHEVTPELAVAMDNALIRSDVEIPAADGLDSVEGAEALGRTLMPKDYLMTRLTGCENFLGDFYKKSREVSSRVSSAFKEGYILFTQSQDTLEEAVSILEKSINESPSFAEGREKIILGARLFNLFKVNGKITEDWTGDLAKLSRTITGLSNNYYLNSKNNLNSTLSYFGGFEGMNQEQALARFLHLPPSIPSERFKECTFGNKTHSTNSVTAKQSVELMGGAYFLDCRQTSPNRNTQSVDAVQDYVQKYVDMDYTGFENSAEFIYPKLGNEVMSLSSQQIKAVAQHLRAVIKEWRKVFDGGERFKLGESDYADITRGIYESTMDDELKDAVLTAFSAVVRKNQFELLNIRAAVNTYLTLIINGLIELSHDSIKVNTP